jgi:hypothetical protein
MAKNRDTGYRLTWKRNNQRPWICSWCGEEIILGEGKLLDSLAVHHKDFNKLNNSLDNLEGLHRACHIDLHEKARCESG